MNFSLILAHPRAGSFNHAIAETVRQVLISQGVNVFYHDLYQENFPPVLPTGEENRDALLPDVISNHCEEIRSTDGIIVVHPNWWGQPPAILTGWVDRVFRPGITYRFVENDKGEGVPQGLLKAHIALVFNTANTAVKRELEVFGDPLETIWKNCVFGLCGINNFFRRTFTIMVTSTSEQRKLWLEEVKTITQKAVQDTRTHHQPDTDILDL
ncbi:MAG TPA: NAD(P)H-dependent oxidoreductase [Chitinispirillaceae bacterium]|nr:NAD(P)H-dependent oxidoreductase [Chitinispirillaceae bacterium]